MWGTWSFVWGAKPTKVSPLRRDWYRPFSNAISKSRMPLFLVLQRLGRFAACKNVVLFLIWLINELLLGFLCRRFYFLSARITQLVFGFFVTHVLGLYYTCINHWLVFATCQTSTNNQKVCLAKPAVIMRPLFVVTVQWATSNADGMNLTWFQHGLTLLLIPRQQNLKK